MQFQSCINPFLPVALKVVTIHIACLVHKQVIALETVQLYLFFTMAATHHFVNAGCFLDHLLLCNHEFVIFETLGFNLVLEYLICPST